MNRIRLAVALALVAFGVWQLGSAGWIHAKAVLAQALTAAAWNRQTAVQAKPWPWADTWPVARLRAPRLGADMFVLAGGSGRTLAFGPGLVDGSAAPGELGMTLIIGHRDTHFRFLRDLLPGDRLSLTDRAGITGHYVVREGRVVHKDRARLAMDAPGLALATCYPFDAVETGGPLRYVVLAEGL